VQGGRDGERQWAALLAGAFDEVGAARLQSGAQSIRDSLQFGDRRLDLGEPVGDAVWKPRACTRPATAWSRRQ